MSMINSLLGFNKHFQALSKVLDLGTFWPVGRIRDVYLTNQNPRTIILFTRNGGGNRAEFQEDVFDKLKTHPNYLRDWDDEQDSTYAYVEFSVPERHKELVEKLAADGAVCEKTPVQRLFDLIEKMKATKPGDEPDPDVKKALDFGKGLVAKLNKSINDESKGPHIVEI